MEIGNNLTNSEMQKRSCSTENLQKLLYFRNHRKKTDTTCHQHPDLCCLKFYDSKWPLILLQLDIRFFMQMPAYLAEHNIFHITSFYEKKLQCKTRTVPFYGIRTRKHSWFLLFSKSVNNLKALSVR